jgi:hypothetical protein
MIKCSIINKGNIDKLYTNPDPIQIKYILHKDPVFRRNGIKKVISKLNWFNPSWVNDFINHILISLIFLK